MNIEQLKYVLILAHHKNFSEASYEISLSQSSLSKQLAKIESELGEVLLFERATRPVKLTAAGEEFIYYAERIVKDFEALKLAMHKHSVFSQKNLVIGCIPVMTRLGLTQMLVNFQKNHHINIEIKERQNKELLELLRKMEIDIAIITGPNENCTSDALIYYPLLEDDFVLVANGSNPLTKKTSIDLAEAKNEVFILLDIDSGVYNICIDEFRKAAFMPQIRQSRNTETIIGLVAEGLGVTLLTRRLAFSFNTPKISIVPLNHPFKRTTLLAVRNQSHHTDPVKKFINYSKEWIKYNITL